MPWSDGIPKIRSFSLTDIHDYDSCVFRFLVRHHLEKKQEIDDSNSKMALGTILDESIKLYHLSTDTNDPQYLSFLVRGAVRHIRESVASKGVKSFYFKHAQFINEELISQATDLFKSYYLALDGKIKKSLGKVGFCEYIMDSPTGKIKLWGGPDTFEMGDDGVPEVVDYKYHEDPEKGASRLDMNLMPKIYMLLTSKFLKERGFKKARFIVRQWTNPQNDGLFEDFDLETIDQIGDLIRQRIEGILANKSLQFCERSWCRACQSKKRGEYIQELTERKFILISQDHVMTSKSDMLQFETDDYDLSG